MAKAIYYVRRDTLGDGITDAQAQRFARALALAIGHDVEWADHSGCDCEDARWHRQDAQDVFDGQTWQ